MDIQTNNFVNLKNWLTEVDKNHRPNNSLPVSKTVGREGPPYNNFVCFKNSLTQVDKNHRPNNSLKTSKTGGTEETHNKILRPDKKDYLATVVDKPQNHSDTNKKKTKKMPPISEKRSPPILKENVKENLSNPQKIIDKINNRVPEILDFRESWLQEIETYKDHMKAQQFLVQHNHHPRLSEGNSRHDGIKAIESVRRRIRTRSDSFDGTKLKITEDELVLKRPREDSAAQTSLNHRHNNNLRGKSTPPSSPAPNIIVNPYHVSLLNYQTDRKKNPLNSTQPLQSSQIPHHLNGIRRKSIGKSSNPGIDGTTQTYSSDKESGKRFEPPVSIYRISNSNDPSSGNDNSSCCKSDNDGSVIEDEEDFTDIIDEDDVEDSSSDSEDEYKGYVYLEEEEEDTLSTSFKSVLSDFSNISSNSSYITPKSPLVPSLFPNVAPYIAFSSHIERGPALPPEVQKVLKWRLTSVMPKIVRRVVANSGFRLIKSKTDDKTSDWVGTWEKHMKSPGFKSIHSHQKFNHLPGTFKIGRKDSVWRNLKTQIGKHGKKEFGIMQRTFVLPNDLTLLKRAWPRYSKHNTKWIIKPPASARGSGIKVVSRWSQIPKSKPLIVQKYIERPLLINGSKFDLRLYVVITSINPLRIYLHTDGLARFASVQYSDKVDTLDDRCMHLTNYSINKLSANYAKNEDINACQGHKWTLKSLWSFFRTKGINTKRLWGTLRNLVVRTVLAGESGLNKMFKMNVNSKYSCYELFGFDVLLDENLVPWLLEVNISPSLHSDLPLDLHVKGPLIQAVLNTALFQIPPNKLTVHQEKSILADNKLKGPLCYDKRLYITMLTPEETYKHNRFTNKAIECREEYLDTILDDLTPDDIRCLIISEDELARSAPMERIFPGQKSHEYLQYIDNPRYYNRLLDAWEYKYSKDREAGIKHLQGFCSKNIHLKVPPAALVMKEPSDDEQSDIVESQSKTIEVEVSVGPIQSNTATNKFCSKQASVPQKISRDVQIGAIPIAVEIK